MKIIRQAETRTHTRYAREYEWADCPGAGFLFDCDETGRILDRDGSPERVANLAACERGERDGVRILAKGVLDLSSSYREPAVGKCDDCGREVVLDSFTCTCECGADYNSCGQRLAPREQWGEETGERWFDSY